MFKRSLDTIGCYNTLLTILYMGLPAQADNARLSFGCRHSLIRHYSRVCKVVLCKTTVYKDYPAFMIPITFISWITLG